MFFLFNLVLFVHNRNVGIMERWIPGKWVVDKFIKLHQVVKFQDRLIAQRLHQLLHIFPDITLFIGIAKKVGRVICG
jgi:hypothetical protein